MSAERATLDPGHEAILEAGRRIRLKQSGITGREPLLGPPEDTAVSHVLLAERPDIDPREADRLAVLIVDALKAIDPSARRIADLEAALEPFAKFDLSGFEGEVLEVVPSSPKNPARRIEPIWTSHFRRARTALASDRS